MCRRFFICEIEILLKLYPHTHFQTKNPGSQIIWNPVLEFGINISHPGIRNRILVVEKVENFQSYRKLFKVFE